MLLTTAFSANIAPTATVFYRAPATSVRTVLYFTLCFRLVLIACISLSSAATKVFQDLFKQRFLRPRECWQKVAKRPTLISVPRRACGEGGSGPRRKRAGCAAQFGIQSPDGAALLFLVFVLF